MGGQGLPALSQRDERKRRGVQPQEDIRFYNTVPAGKWLNASALTLAIITSMEALCYSNKPAFHC